MTRFWLNEQRGTLLALAIFAVMFTLYVSNHPAGFTPNVVQTAANKGVLLALVAIAQTFVVLTAGIDLSVGTIMILTNCVASYLVVGGLVTTTGGVLAVLLTGVVCGAINGAIVIFGRLQPIVTTIATGAVYYGIALWMRPFPGSTPAFNGDLADALTGKVFGIFPASLVFLLGVIVVIWLPFRRSILGRAVYATGSSEVAAYMSGVPIKRAKMLAYVLSGLLAAVGGVVPDLLHLFGRGVAGQWQHLHAVFDCRRGSGRRVAVWWARVSGRCDLWCASVPGDWRSVVRL